MALGWFHSAGFHNELPFEGLSQGYRMDGNTCSILSKYTIPRIYTRTKVRQLFFMGTGLQCIAAGKPSPAQSASRGAVSSLQEKEGFRNDKGLRNLGISVKPTSWRSIMLRWAIIFFIVSIVAALFGFTGIAVAAAGIAKILFFIFLIIFIVFLIMGLMGRRPPPL
jgi:uncharacterized membrane protein YtjA (UPF0391 family)